MATVTKEDIIKAFKLFPPNKWSEIVYKYFSKSTIQENMKPKQIVSNVLICLFLLGFVGTIIKLPHLYMEIVTLLFSGFLTLFVLFLFGGVILNKIRLKKIMKYLNITKKEYNKLIEKFKII